MTKNSHFVGGNISFWMVCIAIYVFGVCHTHTQLRIHKTLRVIRIAHHTHTQLTPHNPLTEEIRLQIFGSPDLSVFPIDLLSDLDRDSVYSREILFEIWGIPVKTCLMCTGTPGKACWIFGSRNYFKSDFLRVVTHDSKRCVNDTYGAHLEWFARGKMCVLSVLSGVSCVCVWCACVNASMSVTHTHTHTHTHTSYNLWLSTPVCNILQCTATHLQSTPHLPTLQHTCLSATRPSCLLMSESQVFRKEQTK